MSFWSRFFGSSYEDDKLESSIQTAIIDDPLITDHTKIAVTSKDGLITLSGTVEKQLEKDHIEGTVRDSLRYNGLKYVRISNDIKVKMKQPVA